MLVCTRVQTSLPCTRFRAACRVAYRRRLRAPRVAKLGENQVEHLGIEVRVEVAAVGGAANKPPRGPCTLSHVPMGVESRAEKVAARRELLNHAAHVNHP